MYLSFRRETQPHNESETMYETPAHANIDDARNDAKAHAAANFPHGATVLTREADGKNVGEVAGDFYAIAVAH